MTLKYTIRFPVPASHCAEITLEIIDPGCNNLRLYMPVWTPGSYLVREFSKHIDSWSCNLAARKENKNTWFISCEQAKKILFTYSIYAFELSVRTSFVDDSQAYLNNAGICIVPEGSEHLPSEIKLIPSPSWKEISTSLAISGKDKWTRMANNYHELADSPILLGNQEVLSFDVKGVPHEAALTGSSNLKKKKFIQDLQRICEEETAIFRHHPCSSYLFLIYHTDTIKGGLEHMDCSSNFIPRWGYTKGEKYNSSMSLLAHEYFHLWNIKRIRPAELASYDYNQEQYTRQLWVAEGITSYYDDYITYKAGIESKQEYLQIVADNISSVVNRPGDKVQSLADASFDTWIKYYRPNENSINSQVHYYQKGAAIAVALNCLILHHSSGKKSLDDVMRSLYKLWGKEPGAGYTEGQVLKVFEKVAGIDLGDFFRDHIYGTVAVNYNKYFNLIGFELKDNSEKKCYTGWSIEKKEGRYMIIGIDPGYGAFSGGIQVQDEILSIDGYRMNDNQEIYLANKKAGDTLLILLSRQGIVRSEIIPLTADKRVAYSLKEMKNPGTKQGRLAKAWLKR